MRVTLLSNGHGEDAVGASLARAFLEASPGLELRAFPTVGRGRAYEALGLPILGPRREMPSGGWMMDTASAFWADLRAGFLPMTAVQMRDLGRLETDRLVVIGDIYALLLSTLVRTSARFYVQTLVSAHLWTPHRNRHRSQGQTQDRPTRYPNRYFMERISAPERFLMRRVVRQSYVRDALTAECLERYGLSVRALGNPMLDALAYEALPVRLSKQAPVVALLPGTRSYREEALETMLETLHHWPEATGLVAWTGETLPSLAAWQWLEVASNVWQGRHPSAHNPVYLCKNRFAGVLHAAQLVLGTAGTANEQAAALGRPVVSFPVLPLYSDAFVANQKRLLGDALSVCARDPVSLAQGLRGLWASSERYEQAVQAGRARMGPAGGSAAIVRDILSRGL